MLNEHSNPRSKPGRVPASPQGIDTRNPTLPWLQDVTKAAQHLTRLTLESSAQAALITRGETLWAYAGQLSQGAAKELALAVTRHWDGQKGSDLLRFVRLEATKAEHMLYATRLADDVVLALVFDAETPFSTIRSQAGQLVDLLSTPSPETMELPANEQKQLSASYDMPTQFAEDESSQDLDIPSIADILSDVPPPTPEPGMVVPQAEEAWGRRPRPPFQISTAGKLRQLCASMIYWFRTRIMLKLWSMWSKTSMQPCHQSLANGQKRPFADRCRVSLMRPVRIRSQKWPAV